MPETAALARDAALGRYPIDEFLAAIAGIEVTTEFTDLKRRSRDFFWYGPILNDELKDKIADVVVAPKDESEVVRNYGQCVPLEGGVVRLGSAQSRQDAKLRAART
jgi:hypothetical protein